MLVISPREQVPCRADPTASLISAGFMDNAVVFEQSTLLEQAFFRTHQRAQCCMGDDTRVLIHMPQATRLDPGQALRFGVAPEAFVVLPRGSS